MSGKGVYNPFQKDGEILMKLFNLFLLFTTGSPEVPVYNKEKHSHLVNGDWWFPFIITDDQMVKGIMSFNTRRSEEEIKSLYVRFAKGGEDGIYLLAILLVKLCTKEEVHEMLANVMDKKL